ncbi:MAG: hypothetical protein NXI07_13215 [bacterium]|nr:hypothetical protein [bacterium]
MMKDILCTAWCIFSFILAVYLCVPIVMGIASIRQSELSSIEMVAHASVYGVMTLPLLAIWLSTYFIMKKCQQSKVYHCVHFAHLAIFLFASMIYVGDVIIRVL